MKKQLTYDEIFYELNEIAAKYKWSNYYNEFFIYLFYRKTLESGELYPYTIYVDLYKLNILIDKVEGLIYTAKMPKMMGYFAEMVLFFIPDITEKENIMSLIFVVPNHEFIIEFSNTYPKKFTCYV